MRKHKSPCRLWQKTLRCDRSKGVRYSSLKQNVLSMLSDIWLSAAFKPSPCVSLESSAVDLLYKLQTVWPFVCCKISSMPFSQRSFLHSTWHFIVQKSVWKDTQSSIIVKCTVRLEFMGNRWPYSAVVSSFEFLQYNKNSGVNLSQWQAKKQGYFPYIQKVLLFK